MIDVTSEIDVTAMTFDEYQDAAVRTSKPDGFAAERSINREG